MLFRERRVSGGDLRFVRGRLVIAGSVRVFRRTMMARRAFVMVRGLPVMLSGVLRHGFSLCVILRDGEVAAVGDCRTRDVRAESSKWLTPIGLLTSGDCRTACAGASVECSDGPRTTRIHRATRDATLSARESSCVSTAQFYF
jgi:hypothetical protein